MITTKKGNILNCTEGIICHQVNVQGIMGGGLARQLADQYPRLEDEYKKYCKGHSNRFINLCGDVYFYGSDNFKYIANMFSQKENFDTSYLNMEIALIEIKLFAKNHNLSVAIPKNIGNGIANGIDGMAEKIIRKVFKNSDVEVTMYEL